MVATINVNDIASSLVKQEKKKGTTRHRGAKQSPREREHKG